MESFGKLLSAKRQEKNIDIETVARETAISVQFLRALEEEDLDVFPAPTYLTGFLHNYGDYLGLDADYLVKLYHAKVLQETPTPAELFHIRKSVWFFILIGILSAAALTGLVFLGIWGFNKWQASRTEQITTISLEQREANTFIITKEPITCRVYKGDILIVPYASGNIELKVLSTDTVLSLSTPVGTQIIELGEDLSFDLNKDGVNEISVFLSDISAEDPNRGAEIRPMLKDNSEPLAQIADDSGIESAQALSAVTERVLINSNRAYPFTFSAEIRDKVLFRYQIDNGVQSEEFLASGDNIVGTAMNRCRFWLSNAGAVKLQVQGDGQTIPLDVGKSGAVLVQDILWVKESDGVYKLIVTSVD